MYVRKILCTIRLLLSLFGLYALLLDRPPHLISVLSDLSTLVSYHSNRLGKGGLGHDERTALIVVDVQNDFLPPNGSLAVPNAREVVPVIRELVEKCRWDLVVATQV